MSYSVVQLSVSAHCPACFVVSPNRSQTTWTTSAKGILPVVFRRWRIVPEHLRKSQVLNHTSSIHAGGLWVHLAYGTG
jgi:hypothetical protein